MPNTEDKKALVLKKLEATIRHCEHVKDATELMGKRMLERGYNADFCVALIVNGRIHDASKFRGIEFEYLSFSDNKEGLKIAVEHHRTTNSHHVGFWGKIDLMPPIFLAELVCDLYARSQEFGTDLREYLKEDFFVKHDITNGSKVGKLIREYVEILLDKPFSKLNP
jgi:hypothetical protein